MSIDYFFAATKTPARPLTLLPELAPYWQQYTNENYQQSMLPIIVDVEVSTPLAGYHPLTLDGLLAFCVVNKAMQGNQLDNSKTPYLLPTPLKMMWRDNKNQGMPLWTANWFQPVSANRKISIYWHKRMIRPEYVGNRKDIPKSQISEVAGRFKEKRIPMPGQIATHWRAECIGNPQEIARLLENIDAIGKKRHAHVIQWTISLAESFIFNRPIPAAYIHETTGKIPLDLQIAAWTPPYWDGVPECKSLCFTQSTDLST